jgi:hypothetical protein
MGCAQINPYILFANKIGVPCVHLHLISSFRYLDLAKNPKWTHLTILFANILGFAIIN